MGGSFKPSLRTPTSNSAPPSSPRALLGLCHSNDHFEAYIMWEEMLAFSRRLCGPFSSHR